jgi:hypothetical protein
MIRLAFFCVFALLLCIRVCDAGRYAVIVGCNKGGSDVVPLHYAESDAREFGEILKTLGGFQASNIRTIEGGDSILLKRSFFSIDSLMRLDKDPNRLFLFYYSGHADVNRLMLDNQHYSLNTLHDYLDSCAAAIKIGIFDACYSGSVTTAKGGKQTQPFFFEEQKTIEGRIIIASASATEQAQESQTLKGSIFSHHWFNALRGSANSSGSKQITINQAYQYAYRKTLETTALVSGEIQHPVFKFDIHGQGDIVLTTLDKASSSVVFDRTCEGKFLVLSDDYIDEFADFSKKSGAENIIALRPGDYRVINALSRDISTHSFSLKKFETYQINAGLMTIVPPSISRFKGLPSDAEKPLEKPSAPLSTFSWGCGASGRLLMLSKGKGSSFLSGLNVIASWYTNSSIDLFLDFHWNFPGINTNFLFGGDYFFRDRQSAFFVGIGLGPYYLEKSGAVFRDHSGASFMCHAGYSADLNRRMQLRIQVPYTLFTGTKIANSIGMEALFVFFGPYRDVKVLIP